MLKTFALGLTFIILFQTMVSGLSPSYSYNLPDSAGLPTDRTSRGSR